MSKEKTNKIEVGEFLYTIPEPTHIFFKEKKKSDQKFDRKAFLPPASFSSLSVEEQANFIVDDMRRRRHGVHFMNCGELTYITGHHFFYLVHWFIAAETADGYPEYRDADRHDFYFFDLVDSDDRCFGEIDMTGRRTGKALALDTDIPTPSGWKKMADIQVGDYVFGSDGKPTRVDFVSDIMYDRPCYDVRLSDGTSIIADEEHKWIVLSRNDRRRRLEGYEYSEQVVDTKHIKENLIKKKESNFCIRNCSPVEYRKKKYLIDPYIMGVWLGDGTSRQAAITNIDKEIIDAWTEFGHKLGLSTSNYKYSDISYYLVQNGGTRENVIRKELKRLNVLGNKHIPDEYLYGSADDRMELLSGIMDTDGCVETGHGGSVEVCSKSEVLANQICELACSLGYRAVVSSKRNKKYGRVYYYVRFHHLNRPPFKLTRKLKSCVIKKEKNEIYGRRFILDVVPVKSVPVKCISVDNSDHSYLCTKSFIKTHNTEKALARLYNSTTLNRNKHSALQSLNMEDAKKNLFIDRVVRSYKALPLELRPLDDGVRDPKTVLRFFDSQTRSIRDRKKVGQKALNSWIDYGATTASEWQGKKLFRILLDEPGSIKEMNLRDWWRITKKCLTIGNKIIGKAMLPTTLEDMKGQGAIDYRAIWVDSDPNQLDGNGRTKSGLYRYFRPGYLGMEGFIDEYGRDMKDADGEYKSKKWLMNEREAADAAGLVALKRQHPFTIDEAFDIALDKKWEDDVIDIFKAVRIQLMSAASTVKYYRFVDLGDSIELLPDKNSPRAIRVIEEPQDNVRYYVGFDGSGSDKSTGDEDGSEVAVVVLKGFSGMDKRNWAPVCWFSWRPDQMEQAYGMFLSVCKWYGKFGRLEALGESNIGQASPVVAYFANRGCIKFIKKRPKNLGFGFREKSSDRYWIYRSPDVKESQIILGNQFFRRYAQNIESDEIIQALINFGVKNSDLADAFLMAVLCAGDFDKKDAPKSLEPTKKWKRVLKRDKNGATYYDWIQVAVPHPATI
jgi:hypothetical protein